MRAENHIQYHTQFLLMATVSLVVRDSRIDARGRAPVRLRIAHQDTRRFLSLDVEVLASKWNGDRQRVTRSHPDADEINSHLAEVESTAHSALSELKRADYLLTAQRVKESIQSELQASGDGGPGDFLSFVEEVVEGYRRRDQHGTFKNYRSIYRKFAEFVRSEYSRDRLPFEALDPELFRSFRTFCYEVCGNSTNTVGKALKVMRTFVRKAMKEGKLDRYPFEHIDIDSEPVERELLTPEEIGRIEELEIDEDSRLAEVRRWFLFAYYTGGMRFSDVASLQWKHLRKGPSGRKRVHYKMQKTSDTVGVPLVDGAREILDYYEEGDPEDWVFPISRGIDPEESGALHDRKEDRNALANKYLQKLAERAEIDKHVSFKLSRNAAAWELYQKVGDIYKVSKFLGHSSVEQTEEYIEGFEDESRDDDFLDAMGGSD